MTDYYNCTTWNDALALSRTKNDAVRVQVEGKIAVVYPSGYRFWAPCEEHPRGQGNWLERPRLQPS